MPLCLVFDFSMFPRDYSPFSGPKPPLSKTWSPKSIINIPLKSIDPDNIIELFDSQFNLTKKFDPPLKNQNPIFDGRRTKRGL